MLILPSVLQGLALTAAEAPKHHILQGVYFKSYDGYVVAIASDGWILVRIKWHSNLDNEYPERGELRATSLSEWSAILPYGACLLAARAAPKRPTHDILRYVAIDESTTNGLVTIGSTDLNTDHVQRVTPIQGKYVDVDSVFSALSTSEHGHFATFLPAKLLKAVTIVETVFPPVHPSPREEKGRLSVDFMVGAEGVPSVLHSERDGITLEVLVMPLFPSKRIANPSLLTFQRI